MTFSEINQTEEDIKFGVKAEDGPLKVKIPKIEDLDIDINNNWYKEDQD